MSVEPGQTVGSGQYRRYHPRRPKWVGPVLAVVAASVLGLIVGVAVPLRAGHTRTKLHWQLPRLHLPSLRQLFAKPIEPGLARLARRHRWGAPQQHVPPPGYQTPLPTLGEPPLPDPWDAPAEPTAFYHAALPQLGGDPLALPPWMQRKRYDNRIAPSGIEPIAKLAHVPIMMYHDVVEKDKDVWFDITVQEFEHDLDRLQQAGCTPISLKQWWAYISRGAAVPLKPILLTFDDGYSSVYNLIYPRLKERGWPAVFFLCPTTVGRRTGKDHITWDQVREMQATGLFEFQAHSMTHPYLTKVGDEQLTREVYGSRDEIQRETGVPVQFFCYPIGDRDGRVIEKLKEARFVAGFTMTAGGSAQSSGMMEVNRYPNQQLSEAVARSDGEMRLAAPPMQPEADLTQPVTFHRVVFAEGPNQIPLVWLTGGKVSTVHADYRYAVPDVARLTGAVGAINGGFFQMARIRDVSNAMLGPVMSSKSTTRDEDVWDHQGLAVPADVFPVREMVPGSEVDNHRLAGRPLVLISRQGLRFVPFDGNAMNSIRAFDLLLPGVTEAFVGGGWLVRDGRALSEEEMDLVSTGDHNDPRRRAWFGITQRGLPVIGASPSSQRSEVIARCLERLGVAQAVLLDSGFSCSLYYNGSIFVTGHSGAQPSRPVPHVILLQSPNDVDAVAGAAASRLESQWRWACGDDQHSYLPPNSRLVDQPEPKPRRRRRRR